MEDLDQEFQKAMEPQIQFLGFLRQLTDLGRAEFVYAEQEPGFIHCLVDEEELIVFDCGGGVTGNDHVHPSEPLTGVVAKFRNTSYLWLTGQANWDTLIGLLRSARVDDDRFSECRRIADRATLASLRHRITK